MALTQPSWTVVDLVVAFLLLKVMAFHLPVEHCFPCYARFLVKALDDMLAVVTVHGGACSAQREKEAGKEPHTANSPNR